MVEIRIVDALHKTDINIPNEPFQMFGKIIPSYDGTSWTYQLLRFDSEVL